MEKHSVKATAYAISDILRLRFSLDGQPPAETDPATLTCEGVEGVKNFIHRLGHCTSNKEYKALLTSVEGNPIKRIHDFVLDNYPEGTTPDLDIIRDFLLSEFLSAHTEGDDIEPIVLLLWTFFLKENQLGQSVYTEYVEETKAPIDQHISDPKKLPAFAFDHISSKNTKLQETLLDHFEKDGENVYDRAQFLIVFFALEVLTHYWVMLKENDEPKKGELPHHLLWQARFSMVYSQLITQNVEQLQNTSVEPYQRYVAKFREAVQGLEPEDQQVGKTNLSMLLSETSYCFIHYWMYDQCEEAIAEALDLLGIKIALTGKLGKRTKWQQDDVTQLILDIHTKDVTIKQERKKRAQAEGAIQGEESSLYVKQDEESILWEQPVLKEDEEKKVKKEEMKLLEMKEMIAADQLAIQAYINYLFITLPSKEEQTFEEIRPYYAACVQKQNNWLTFSKALLYRSRNEIMRSKTMERSLSQTQALIDQFREQQTKTLDKMDLVFSSFYPMSWGVKQELAENYQKIGVFMSAYELLKTIGVFDQAVKCLFMAGRQQQAVEMAEDLMKSEWKFKRYDLMCLMGEMKRDHTWFEKAWEESGHRCAKAMRNLGQYYFYEQNYAKSVECFQKQLALNKLYPESWFTMGCAYMRLEDMKNAIFSFGKVINIDDRKIEAWANMGNCYIAQKKHFEAVTCCEQALKINRKSWKIWNNYILFSIETFQFYKAVMGVRELLRYDQLDDINPTLILRISDCFIKKFVNNMVHVDDPNRMEHTKTTAEEFKRHKEQLYKFYFDLTEKINDYRYWRLICRIKQTFREPYAVIKETKLKEVRAIMKINWHVELETCELVEKTMGELVNDIFPAGEVSDEEKQFVRNTAKTIADTLKRECKVTI